jgi:KDO2-lipid IV(A) lauroyltransferase
VTLRYRLEYGLVLVMRAIVRVLPDASARGLGSFVGLFFYAVDRSHRRLAIRQLRAAFPTRSEAECRAVARATFAHFGRLLVVLLKFSTLSADQIRERVEFEGEDRVQAALSRGHGAIIFTGHFGYWELQGLAQPLVLPSLSVLARPLDNPYLHLLLEKMRTATGNRVIYRRGALRRVLRALNANECVAILIDQHIQGSDAVRVDFFNRTGAPLIPAFALPLARGRYRLIYEHPIDLPPPGSADPVHDLTQRCTDVLEMYVRRFPDLWLWMHRRWRDAGDDATPMPGMFPAAASDEREEPVE